MFTVEAEAKEPESQTGLFRAVYEEVWVDRCPACSCRAFMAGDQVWEHVTEEADRDGVWEIVERELHGEEFRCPTCDLRLAGSPEIETAGLHWQREDRQEREMEYEPDYGND